MKTTKQRHRERIAQRQRLQFHSEERIRFIKALPCEVTGREDEFGVVNAHTAAGGVGRRGSYRSIVPLWWKCHTDFDEMPEEKFEAKYGRTKASVRARAPHYHQLWEESR